LWLPFLIVGLKAFWNFDFYLYFDHTWIMSVILFALAVTLFGIWLSMNYVKKKIASPFLNKVLNNISMNDVTGKRLVSAMNFLDEIEEFEKEDN